MSDNGPGVGKTEEEDNKVDTEECNDGNNNNKADDDCDTKRQNSNQTCQQQPEPEPDYWLKAEIIYVEIFFPEIMKSFPVFLSKFLDKKCSGKISRVQSDPFEEFLRIWPQNISLLVIWSHCNVQSDLFANCLLYYFPNISY